MKILIDHREVGYFYGGAENHIRELSKKLIEKGHNIIFLTEKGKKDPLIRLRGNPNIKIVYLPSFKIRRSKNFKNFSSELSKKIDKSIFITKFLRVLSNIGWMAKSGFWILINRDKFDVVWVSKYSDTLSLRLLNKFIKIPYIESLEGYDYIEAENAKNVKNVFAISKFIRDQCKKIHKFEPKLITIGIDQKKFQNVDKQEVSKIRSQYKKNKNDKIILNVARLVESKDLSTFVKASSKVSKKFKDVKFLICGDGEERQKLNNLIKELNLNKKVFILNVFGDDLIKYYAASDIFVHVPKQGNHFGVVYIEAMAAGLPIIASNMDASPKTVGDCAILVTPGDVIRISNAIEDLIENEKLRKKLSKNSLNRAKLFDWNKIVKEVEHFLSKAIT